MNYNFTKTIVLMSKLTVQLLICLLITMDMVFANESAAQAKSVKEVRISLNLDGSSLAEAFRVIEDQTQFKFSLSKEKINLSESINLDYSNATVEEVLLAISKIKRLEFRQVNNNIGVSKASRLKKNKTLVTIVQEIVVSGVITDENGESLPGVTILEKGTTNGTTTDANGNYRLVVPDGSNVLVFSSVGYKDIEVNIDSRSEINLTMVPSIEALEEIIVVGYGTQENRKVSAAVSQVDAEELEISKRPVPNVQQSLIGTIPGLIINQTSGRPGEGNDIKVRSVSALEERNALVLIDGFEGSIEDVNPADIETVTVLKDAAATAIYGARSANGVVLITTKKTKRNEGLTLTYSMNQSFQKPAQTAELANSVQFIEFSNESILNETLRNDPARDPATISLPFSDEELQRARSGFYPDTKWVDELYNQNAGQSSHNITVGGGSERTGYFINLGYLKQNGLVGGSENLKRYNIRVKLDTDITDWLTIGANISNVVQNLNRVPVAEGNAVRGRPFFPVQLPDGTYVDKGAAGGEPNPVGRANSGSYDKEQNDALNLQLYTRFNLLEGLNLEARISYVKDNDFREIWNTPYEFAILDMELNQVGENIPVVPADRNLLFRSVKQFQLNSLVTANYKKQIANDHNINVLAGWQVQDGESVSVEAERFNYILPTLQDLKLGQEINGFGNSSSRGDNRTTISYFSRLAYDFRGKYLAEFNLRADASSNFGPNNQWGIFPAVSLGWNLADEPFISNLEFFDVLKMRASWGLNGDDGSINAVERVAFNPTGISFGGQVFPTLNLGEAINPDLKWETSEKINLGLDLNVFQGKLGISGEYFIDRRSDIITQLLTSVEGGLGGVLDNVYDAESWGWEFDISHRNDIGEFTYFANLNFSIYNSEITNTDGISPLSLDNTQYQDVGLPILGNWFGYETDGYFDNQEEIDGYVDTGGNPIDQSSVVAHGDQYGRYLGGFKYIDQLTEDTNNDGIPDARDGVINADDRVVLKENTGDNHRIGFNLGVSYAGFTLSSRFYGVLQGWQWWRAGTNLNPFTGDIAPFVYQMDTWRPDNLDATFPQATASNIIPFDQNVSHLIQKNAYIKMKNINLGYTFNPSILEKLRFVKGLELYGSVENLGVIWTNNPSFDTGWDPELGTGNFRYPLPIVTSFGANIKF